jgi:cyanophycinase
MLKESNKMQLTEANGKLMAIGGAEDREGECLILKEFVRLADGENARIAVMTTATESRRNSEKYISKRSSVWARKKCR